MKWLLLGAALASLACGCARPTVCVPLPEDTTGEPRQKYDEFTRTTWLTSWFVFTPDSVWGLEDHAVDGRQWSVELWLRGSSQSPLVELTLRPMCSRPDDDDIDKCINCDDVCSERTGYMEILADNQIVNMPRARYRRDQVGSPTPESPATWASSLSLEVDPRALWPLAQARQVKFRVCNAVIVTMPDVELANLQRYLREHQGFAPQNPPGSLPGVPPVSPPP